MLPMLSRKRREIRDETAEVTKKEENREKYRDSENIAGDIRRKGAPRTLGMEKKKEEKRCGTHGSLALSDGARLAARVRVSGLVHAMHHPNLCIRGEMYVH
ncbi:unnamed protein product [Lasius platythorax]|uniref:Uncharacterized protein n=1 Tax=Lasius platythorax TaxID=488582 RepID=A0AAV2NQT6_9HYME